MAVFICQGCGAEHATWVGKCPDCGTTETIRLAQTSDKMIDKVIRDKFRIVRKLGQGGMGAVYLAEQVGIGHRVALKFLKAEFSTDPEIARRFLNEAKSYARVAHPNAVALHDFGQDDEGNLFIAMEYCEGVDLKKVIAEQGRLPVIEGIDVVLQVADVLANAHDKGVIHRDLKPENIMIRRGMRGVHAKVLDFGIARLMDAGTKLTQAGAIAGTPRYMSPEQVEGKEVDLRADIYSLGIVLFECLTGRQPFDGNTIAEILRKQAFEPLPHMVELAQDLDYPELDQVVQKACAKRRDDRWPDMLTFASALSQATPTQAHLGLSPLERSRHSGRMPMMTPVPGALGNSTPASTSGMALPGQAVDESSTEGTVLRSGYTPAHQQAKDVAAPVTAVAPTGQPTVTGPTGQPTVTGPLPGKARREAAPSMTMPMGGASGTSRPLEGDLSMVPPPARKSSSAPLFAGLSAVAVVVAVGAVLAMQGGSSASGAPRPDGPTAAGPGPVVTAQPTAPAATGPDVAAQVVKALDEAKVKGDFARGTDEFKAGNLDLAETWFRTVPDSSDLYPRADEMLGKIREIRTNLAQANSARLRGQCQRAMPLYQAVLQVNGAVREARSGYDACTQAAVPTILP